MRNHHGLTLIELVIVLAVIAIIGAILIPNFLTTTDKARLKSDIQSARVIQNARELYDAEQSTPMTDTGMAAILTKLSEKGYLAAGQAVIQTKDAEWVIDADMGVVVDISGLNLAKIYDQLSDIEKQYVKGGTGPGVS